MQVPVGAEDEEGRQGGGRRRRAIHGGASGRGFPGEGEGKREGGERVGRPAGNSGSPRRRRISEPLRMELDDGGGSARAEGAGLAPFRRPEDQRHGGR